MKTYLTTSFIEEYSIIIKDASLDLLLNYTPDELKATSKNSLVSVIEFLSAILHHTMTPEEVGEIIEQFQLQISMMCLDSPSLEKRLQGLQVINNLIEMVNRRENEARGMRQYQNYYPNSSHNRKSLATTKWLTSELLLNWMEDKKVIDTLFGVKMHQELLKRSNEIFKFSDSLVDSLTSMIDREYKKKLN